jgi:RHH-type proline utilization regulon transcriptional repressor/proline dehydrogenase/delta 1-pyrroline-5-carboxylate dehydrogenase
MTDFYDLKFQDENDYVRYLVEQYESFKLNEPAISQQAQVLIETIRARKHESKGFQALMQGYDLSSEEGLALMTLAEALLRIPDADTANALINDKLSEANWNKLFGQARDVAGKVSGFGLSLSQKVMGSMLEKIGMPFIRNACVQAMQLMGKTFVLGRDIDEALKESKSSSAKGYTHSFDMLGEGARTAKDAEIYFDAYLKAIRAIGQSNQMDASSKDQPMWKRPGISIKLSALHPRYEYAQTEICEPALTEKLLELCAVAMEYRMNLTVDAEECDRLGLSLRIIQSVIESKILADWSGFGIAVQAYHKRADAVIDRVIRWSKAAKRKTAIRLVKGAYWDTEIKHAQVEGLPNFPVFTVKENTDLNYLVCAKKLLDNRDVIIPMLGTHNAQTVSAIIEMAGNNREGFIFQRLHGMGEQLYDQILSMDLPVCVYAPVGTHKDLLAYLVRRLLENGANSSFVNKIYDGTPIDDLIETPYTKIMAHGDNHTHPNIRQPAALFAARKNSKGLDLASDVTLRPIQKAIHNVAEKTYNAPCLINGEPLRDGMRYTNDNPSNKHDAIGDIWYADDDTIKHAFKTVRGGFAKWNTTDAQARADILNAIADTYEDNTYEIMGLLVREAGKTIPDAIAEVREAVDFCRYYAVEGVKHFTEHLMEGPTGERNTLSLEGRGIFVCISPWNFPFAIFTGQIVAALMAGNSVISKPAEQTPAIATYAIRLMIKAGVPIDAIAVLQGDGDVGSKIINHTDVGGVAFTGSTQVSKIIQRTLADKDGPIVPLIAETGGLNCMIVDSSALPEQVTDDVIHSAFGSAGQRCSALRILCVQDDVADGVIKMIKGAMDYIIVGDPSHISTDVGPIIDQEAMTNLIDHRVELQGIAHHVVQTPYDERLDQYGNFFTPVLAEIEDIDMIDAEAFGPILHVVRYKEDKLFDLIKRINAKGFGLTFGLHTRIHTRQKEISDAVDTGNIYINRGQTGAVVGSQPFGGRGLSGTGPKAGGPYYLHAFATEKAISVDTTASGGNASLINL